MSCFVMNPGTISGIADSVATVVNLGFNYNGFDCPQSLRDAVQTFRTKPFNEVSARRVYKAMFALNVRAVCGRYRETADETAPDVIDAPPVYLHYAESVRIGEHWARRIEPGVYQLVKALDCYLYQTDEDGTKDDPLRKGLDDLRTTLCRFITVNAPEYIEAPWC